MNNYRQGEITPTMLAYMAGFFDAEGCVCISKSHYSTKNFPNRESYYLRCTIAQKYSGVLEVFRKYYGGNIQKSKDGTLHWYIDSSKSLIFLREIEPYLIEKKEEVQVAINYQVGKLAVRKNFNKYHPMSDTQVAFNNSQYLLLKKLKFKKLRQLPLMEIHSIEQIYAYLAGFFDGEGFIGIRTYKPKSAKGKVYHHLIASVSQSNKAYVILELFRYYFSGAIHHNSKREGVAEWMVASRQAETLINTLLPYLIVKDEQACLAIEFQKGVHIGKGKGSSRFLTEQELAVREAQKILLHDLKKSKPACDFMGKQEGAI